MKHISYTNYPYDYLNYPYDYQLTKEDIKKLQKYTLSSHFDNWLLRSPHKKHKHIIGCFYCNEEINLSKCGCAVAFGMVPVCVLCLN